MGNSIQYGLKTASKASGSSQNGLNITMRVALTRFWKKKTIFFQSFKKMSFQCSVRIELIYIKNTITFNIFRMKINLLPTWTNWYPEPSGTKYSTTKTSWKTVKNASSKMTLLLIPSLTSNLVLDKSRIHVVRNLADFSPEIEKFM